MVENTRLARSREALDRFDEAIRDPRLYEEQRYDERHERPHALSYEPDEAAPGEPPPHAPVPLFLSNHEDRFQQELSRYTFASGGEFASGRLKKSRLPRIATGVVSISAIGALLALLSIDSTRAVIFRGSLGGSVPAQFGAVQPEPATPAQQRIAAPPVTAPSATSPPVTAEASAPDAAAARRSPADAMAWASPTRDEIAAAYQGTTRSKSAPEPAAREAAREATSTAPAVREAAPATRETAPTRRINPDELAALLKRAKGLLAIGDIASARLLLERAADAREAEAALMLAGTYDPQVLGSHDMRSVSPDPAAARVWYQKAAQLGSADAQRRLGQLQR
ncbi:hypothetical protein [Bradyrhizobium sp.]|uniref:hypothetical protein n=1 Tax=Bradyrhizobium sp. TaxID=376 RepID=UPI0025C37DAE|nr:hypothetical protein [Bradyrhizobium sp.]